MISVKQKDEKKSKITFGEIRHGDCFFDGDSEGIWFKVSDDYAYCLEDGSGSDFDKDEQVIEVKVEVRWEFMTK